MNAQEYISPFRENSFSQRINSVINFGFQNFKKIITLHLIVLIPLCLICSLLKGKLGDYTIQIANGVSSMLALSFMLIYIKNKSLDNFKTNELFKNFGVIFAKGFILGLIVSVLCIPIIFFILFLSYIEEYNTTLFNTVLLITLVLSTYLTVVAQIFTTHYLLTNNSDIISAIKEAFKMIKGRWWDTLLFILFFNIPRFIIMAILIAATVESNNIFLTTIVHYFILLASFFLSDIPLVYQYGYLITQRINKDNAATDLSNTTHDEVTELQEEKPQPQDTETEESIENEPAITEEEVEKSVPIVKNGTFKIEGNGYYALELYNISNKEQISEALSTLIGLSEEEIQEKTNDMPSIIADKLSITEALELSSLIHKYGGSTNIK